MTYLSPDAKDGVIELYQGEFIGEVFFNHFLAIYQEPVQQYKIGTMLQLETETKARLRPFLMSQGIDIKEDPTYSQQGLEVATEFAKGSWEEMVRSLNKVLKTFVARYQEIAKSQAASHAHKEFCESMVIHECSLLRFTELEIEGNGEHSVDAVEELLQYPLPRPAALSA